MIPVTFKVTVAVCVTEAAVIEIVPLHVVPAASPAGFTEIVKFVFVGLAVKLPVGERISQLLLVQLCSETCAVALVLVCAVTVSVCEAGVAPPGNRAEREGRRAQGEHPRRQARHVQRDWH